MLLVIAAEPVMVNVVVVLTPFVVKATVDSLLTQQEGALSHGVLNVRTQLVITPLPVVTFPAASLPTIDGLVPHEDKVGDGVWV